MPRDIQQHQRRQWQGQRRENIAPPASAGHGPGALSPQAVAESLCDLRSDATKTRAELRESRELLKGIVVLLQEIRDEIRKSNECQEHTCGRIDNLVEESHRILEAATENTAKIERAVKGGQRQQDSAEPGARG